MRTVRQPVSWWIGNGAIILACLVASGFFPEPMWGEVSASDAMARAATAFGDPLDDDDDDPTPAAGNNCCEQKNCGNGCSICCPANKEAHCECREQKVPCPPFTPYPGPCYKYWPHCSCR